MAYTADKPQRGVRPSSELRSSIPGWGVDLDPKDRPASVKELHDPSATGAHWQFPERQIQHFRREMSPEHQFLTPVYGTTCPLKGVSGMVRSYAYGLSEGRTAHWLLLMLADRIDVLEERVKAFLRGRPDNLLTETGVLSEFKRHGLRSRVGRHRNDLKQVPLDVLLVAGPTVAIAGAVYALSRLFAPKRRVHRLLPRRA